ncbi:MAG: N-acyl homoserine lactonase family protein, partial [Halanaeroarchaeum sp.]
GHTPGVMGTMIHLDDHGTIIFASDEVYRETNYVDEVPLGAGLLWSKPHWKDSLSLLKDLERRHDAEVVYGHDPEQFEEIRSGWSS